jgi:hypothetical protein
MQTKRGSLKSGKGTLGQQAFNKMETTMTSPYLDLAQKWSLALRTLMTHPGHTQRFDTTAWCFSSPRIGDDIAAMAQLAADKGCDLVHVACALDADEPLSVSLAIRGRTGVRWIPNARLYAADENAPIELLTDSDRWFIGALRRLSASELPPQARRVSGEGIAWRRWREKASQMEAPSRDGMIWVPRGGTINDAIPYSRINVTT